MDVVAGGAFLSLTLTQATNLVEKNVNPARKKEKCTISRR
jgi:hypothetical protein